MRLSFAAMPEPEEKLMTRSRLAVDAVLVAGFILFAYTVLAPHVPSKDPRMIRLWGLITTLCVTGVFWLALQMFRVTLRAQRKAKRR
jgi:RsiW-degrading membrane proteinase PrsW (M82 family)